MSSHDSKLKTRSKLSAVADGDEHEEPDTYHPEPEMVLGADFDSTTYGRVEARFVIWTDPKFTQMSVNVYKLVPKGMCMETYVPVLIGSYPYPNTKH